MSTFCKSAALAAAVLSACSSFAADEGVIIVTGTRFEEPASKTAANVAVVTAEDIRDSPATNLPDVLSGIAGVAVRPLFGTMAASTTVDIRGFGETAGSNTLVLVNGQRQSAVDSSGVNWAAIPMSSVQRIEVIRGSGTVLYGDNASGGVINIITDRKKRPPALVTATIGSNEFRSLDVQGSVADESTYLDMFANYADTNGWRDNSQTDQQSLTGRLGRFLAKGEVFLDYGAYKDSSGFPGALFSYAYKHHPRSTRFPDNYQTHEGYRIRPGISYELSDTLELNAEAAVASETYDFHSVLGGMVSERNRPRDTVSFTPRMLWRHGLGSLASATTAGFDYYDGQVTEDTTGAAYISKQKVDVTQKSGSFYVSNATELNERWSVNLGSRTQRMDQQAQQNEYLADFFGFGASLSPAFSGDSVRTRSAHEIALIWQEGGVRAFGKLATTFRFANADELFAFDPITFNPTFAGDLKPQHGTQEELGVAFNRGALGLAVSAYRLKLEDEIGYDPVIGANVNFDDTLRKGLEAELTWKATAQLDARFSYTYTKAMFNNGPYDGNEIPLVSKDMARLKLIWQSESLGTYTLAANYVGESRYGGDFTNSHEYAPDYTTVDLQGAWQIDRWRVTAKVINATNKQYSPYSGLSFAGLPFYYPADERSVFTSGTYQF